MIIGISGRIGSGKDLVGQIIQYLTDTSANKAFTIEQWLYESHYSHDITQWRIKKFADKLKECAVIILGIPRISCEDIDVKNGLISETWGELTLRKFLQLFGTEVGRSIHPDFWVNALFSEYTGVASNWDADGNTTVYNVPMWIITDVRFHNEAAAVKARGGIMIRLGRNSNVDSDHISETALDTYTEFNYVIDNSNTTIDELIQIVKSILISEHIITKE